VIVEARGQAPARLFWLLLGMLRVIANAVVDGELRMIEIIYDCLADSFDDLSVEVFVPCVHCQHARHWPPHL
jgi:hypothetical protein